MLHPQTTHSRAHLIIMGAGIMLFLFVTLGFMRPSFTLDNGDILEFSPFVRHFHTTTCHGFTVPVENDRLQHCIGLVRFEIIVESL